MVPSDQAGIALWTRIHNEEIPGLPNQAELFRDLITHRPPHRRRPIPICTSPVIQGKSPVGLPMPGLLKKTKKEEWNEKVNRALQEIAWETVTRYPCSGVTAAKEK
jgi:hypothetical protein